MLLYLRKGISTGNSEDHINNPRSQLKGSKYDSHAGNMAVYCCAHTKPLWFLGSLLYFNREPDAQVRCMSRLEPDVMSEVNT